MSHPTTPSRDRRVQQNCIQQHTTPHRSHALDARNHYPQIKHHTPPPKQGNNNQPPKGAPPPPTTQVSRGRLPTSGFPHSGRRDSGLVVSKPNSVSGNPSPQSSRS